MNQIPERDWKKLRTIRPQLINRFCAKALKDIQRLLEESDLETQAHDSYLELFQVMRSADRQVADLFNDWRRSTVYFTLKKWLEAEILTKDEYLTISQETRDLMKESMGQTRYSGE